MSKHHGFKQLSLLLCLIAASSAGDAAESPIVEQDTGRDAIQPQRWPCVAELCLGDTLGQLNTIRWNSVPRSRALTSEITVSWEETLSGWFRGDVRQAVPYLAVHAFDGNALLALTGVTNSCDIEKLYGTYMSAHGNPTRVAIALLPGRGASEEWTVVEITREIRSTGSLDQREAVVKALKRKYMHWISDAGQHPNYENDQPAVSVYTVNNVMVTLELRSGEATLRKLSEACVTGDVASVD